MNPEPKIEKELDEDISLRGASEDDELTIPADEAEDAQPENAEAMDEAQEQAAQKRKEGSYQ